MTMTNQQIAEFLNNRAQSRKAFAVSRRRIGDGHNLADNPDLFPGEVLLPANPSLLQVGGERWTAEMIAAELDGR